MMLKKLLMFAITSGLAAKLVQSMMQRSRGGAHRANTPKPAVERWEDEGGLVPDVAKPPQS
jgi:hypothetical protein